MAIVSKRPITDKVIEGIHQNLVEFGYNTLTLDETKHQVDLVLAEQKEGQTIIGKFAKNMLEENGFI